MGILKKCLTIGLCTTVMCLGLNANGTSSLAKTPVDQMPIAGVTSLLAEMRTIKVSVSSTEATEVGNNETTPVEEVVVQPYTDEDLYLLSHVIAGEANYCDYNMKLYVGSVVLNRVKSPLFPNTLKSVIFQKGQYQCTWDGHYYMEPTDETKEIAKKLLTEGSALPENVIFQAEFKQGKGVYIKHKNMYFCWR